MIQFIKIKTKKKYIFTYFLKSSCRTCCFYYVFTILRFIIVYYVFNMFIMCFVRGERKGERTKPTNKRWRIVLYRCTADLSCFVKSDVQCTAVYQCALFCTAWTRGTFWCSPNVPPVHQQCLAVRINGWMFQEFSNVPAQQCRHGTYLSAKSAQQSATASTYRKCSDECIHARTATARVAFDYSRTGSSVGCYMIVWFSMSMVRSQMIPTVMAGALLRHHRYDLPLTCTQSNVLHFCRRALLAGGTEATTLQLRLRMKLNSIYSTIFNVVLHVMCLNNRQQ